MNTQDAFNWFYDAVLGLLNYFYTEQTITVTSTDPYYITPAIKAKLHLKNRKTSSTDLWAAVRQLTGRRQTTDIVEGIIAESLNQHYAHISTDADFQMPQCKHTAACGWLDVVSEWQVFRMLDMLHNTSTGLDNIPEMSLRLGSPVFCKPVALLYNKSISTLVVSRQWKSASI